jgi:hypothetical protein
MTTSFVGSTSFFSFSGLIDPRRHGAYNVALAMLDHGDNRQATIAALTSVLPREDAVISRAPDASTPWQVEWLDTDMVTEVGHARV